MFEKLDMTIPSNLLGLSEVEIDTIYLRNGSELVIDVESTREDTTC